MDALPLSLHRTPIEPLVLRHVQDAAWYWSQLPEDSCTPRMDLDRARHLQSIFVCHLEGAHHAGELAWQTAMKELKRWKEAEQYFVCWHLALRQGSAEKQEALLEWLPRLYCASEAVAAALQWSEAAIRIPFMESCLQGDNPSLRVIALNACALTLHEPSLPVEEFFQAEDVATLAAACHWAGTMRRQDLVEALLRVARLPHSEVREAAGLALLRCGRNVEAWPLLREAMLHRHALAFTEESPRPLREELRAQWLACALGHAIPDLETLAAEPSLPPYLLLLILSHLGDARALETLVNCMEPGNPYAVRALWALRRITGLDVESEGLCLPATASAAGAEDTPPHPGCRQDVGLPEPHHEKIRHWLSMQGKNFPPGKRLLAGNEASLSHCVHMLRQGQQDQRLAASWHVLRLAAGPQVDTEAPLLVQRDHMRRLRILAG